MLAPVSIGYANVEAAFSYSRCEFRRITHTELGIDRANRLTYGIDAAFLSTCNRGTFIAGQ